jgi:hypothetical protein
VGDGRSDDTTRLQQAINYCIANGRPLFIPTGSYITTGLTLNNASGITVFGAGTNQTKLLAGAGCTAVLTISGGANHLTLHDFGVDGSAGSGQGILFSGAPGFLYLSQFYNLNIFGCKSHGLNLTSAFSYILTNVTAVNNEGDQIRGWGGPGVYLEGCNVGGVSEGRSGFRFLGDCTLVACNGLYERTNPGGTIGGTDGAWAKFGGDNSAESDFQYGYPSVTLIGCNVESFSRIGIQFIQAHAFCSFERVSFLTRAGARDTVAVYENGDVAGGGLPLHMKHCSFTLVSIPGTATTAAIPSTWADGLPLHTNNGRVAGENLGGQNRFYDESSKIPYDIAGSDYQSPIDNRIGSWKLVPYRLKGNVQVDNLGGYFMGGQPNGGGSYSFFTGRPAMPSTGNWKRGDVVWNVGDAAGDVLGSPGSIYTLLGWRRVTTGNTNTPGTDWVELRALTGN